MRWRTLLSVLAFLFVIETGASAQLIPPHEDQPTNTLKGKVRSIDGNTVNNAIVELRIGGGGMISQTVTRNDGDFLFSNLESGEYEVAVIIAGYEPAVQVARFSQSAQMKFSEVVNIEVMIRPKKEPAMFAPGINFVQDVPKPARVAYEKGIARLREGKSEEGVAALREAIGHFNDYFAAYYALGREMFRAGKDKEALEAFERARQINDRQDAVYYMFGLVMLKERKFGVAEYAFREAIRLNATNSTSHLYHAESLIELAIHGADARQRAADLDAADQELNKAWDTSNKRLNVVYVLRARIHESKGDKEAAARELENYLKAEPEARNAAAIRDAIAKLRAAKK
jgi:tetratricopeptide (TPR) repeat protein